MVVRPLEPQRRARVLTAIALAWLASLAICAWLARDYALVIVDNNDSLAMRQARAEIETLEHRIAVLERSEQVGKNAGIDLQQTLRERQEEIAGLRADLGFYSRLTGGNGKREGLTVHSLHLAPVAGSRAYNFTVTLTQNLKKGQIATGRVRVSVVGVRRDTLENLRWQDLGQQNEPTGLEFAFKYFQRISGTVMLPEGFTANRIKVEAETTGSESRVQQDFAWSEALANEEPIDVQQ
jgi:hypothetical protein